MRGKPLWFQSIWGFSGDGLDQTVIGWIAPRQHRFQIGLYLWPLGIEDAEVNRVADPAGPGDQVPAQDAFFFRADAEDRVARSLIQSVGLEFDEQALPDFESVAQHEVLGFGVDGSALPRRGDPGGADFHSAVDSVDVHEAGAADHLPGTILDSGKRH